MIYEIKNTKTEKTYLLESTNEEIKTVEPILFALVQIGYNLNGLEISKILPKNA